MLSPLPFSFQLKKMIGSGCAEEARLDMQGLCGQAMEMGSRAWTSRLRSRLGRQSASVELPNACVCNPTQHRAELYCWGNRQRGQDLVLHAGKSGHLEVSDNFSVL